MALANRLRTPEAARYVGLAAKTLEKLRLTKGGPPLHPGGPRRDL